MKKLITGLSCLLLILTVSAQDSTVTKKKKDWSKQSLAGRTGDHFMIQLGTAGWSGAPDSINISGFSKSVNVYFLIDFPFKTDPRFSVALGPGIGTDNISFSDTYIGLKDQTSTLQFRNVADTNHFKKYKLVSAFLEAPVELRFSSNPFNNKKSFKAALGLKVGTLVDIHTKGKKLQNSNGNDIGTYTEKIKDKRFFNSNRFVGTVRVGRGNFTLFGTYQFGSLIKEGFGPVVRPYSFGITLSGL